ncbi:MAG: threonine/serine exporter family protein [Gammaproteobacteria bacterium]|nr:MAG: threonine/serine exporter family protein [Gammaproteobacteria bacterium]
MTQLSESHITEQRSLDDILNAPDRNKPIGFILRLAKALHTYGLPAYELEKTMNGCAKAMGYGIQCMSLPTSISITILPDSSEPRTYLIRVSPGEVNIEKLRKTTEIARHVINDKINSQQGAECLKEIAVSGSDYPNWIIVLAFCAVSTCIAHIFSGGIAEMIASATIGLLVGLLAIASGFRPIIGHLLPAICAFVATFISLLINQWSGFAINTSVVILSGLIILLPGLTLTVALAELATQNLVSGTARLAGTMTTFIQLAVGSALAGELANQMGLMSNHVSLEAASFWSLLLSVSIASLALIPLFSARKQDAGWFLAAALTAFITVYFSSQLMGPSLGAFAGAITVGLLAKLVTKFFDVPGAMIVMPGFIILVPGAIGYQSILAFVENDVSASLSTAYDVIVIGISLVAGFLLSSLVHLPKDEAKDHY